MGLDKFDARILNLLQHDNQLTSAELAEKVNLSPASCLRRIRRLRDDKVIAADVSLVAPEKVGHGVTLVVLVSVERENAQLRNQFQAAMKQAPEVLQCYYVTGEVDFVLVLSLRNLSDYDAFSTRFFFDNPNVKRFSTMAVMNRVKVATAIEVQPDE